jgi:urea transporter
MAPPSFVSGDPVLDFIYILFNGISEVPLISSVLTGVLILIGTVIASRKAALMMVLGSLIGAVVGLILGVPYGMITFGLLGYNSILSAMSLWSGPFVKMNRATLVLSLFDAVLTVVVFLALDNVLGNLFVVKGGGFSIPSFTLSFCVTTWAIMMGAKYYGIDIFPRPKVPSGEGSEGWGSASLASSEAHEAVASGVVKLMKDSGNPEPQGVSGFKWTPWEFTKAVLNGVSQVTFIENWVTGLFWVIGLTLSFTLVSGNLYGNAYTANWDVSSSLFLAGAMALIGSAIGVAFAILVKFPTTDIRSGLHGFNQVLLMIALTSFLPLTLVTFLYAVFATIVCTIVVVPAVKNIFGRWGLPGLTGPFNFTAIFFMLVAPLALNIPFGLGWGRP